MGFTTPSYSLNDLFERIDRSELQLPDFQHEYTWDIDRIRSMLTTVLRGYPVGSLLALDTRNTPSRFKPRPVKGAPNRGVQPGLLLLDGQQRLTALYHSLRGDGVVDTVGFRGNSIRRRFFVDVVHAVENDPMPDEAVFAVDMDGNVRSHFGPSIPGGIKTRDDLINNHIVPVSSLLGEAGNDLLFDMATQSDDPQIRDAVKQFHNRIVRAMTAYDIPMVRLDRDTAQRGIGQIFAQANSVGQPMDVFELLTAVFANEDHSFRLADHWAEVEAYLRRHPALDGVERIQFLRSVALLVTSRRGSAMGHRGDILNLSLQEYLEAAEELLPAYDTTAEFLYKRRIVSTDQVPYSFQLVPLTVIFAILKDSPEVLESVQGRDRLNQWFWSGVFGELYGSAAPTIRAGRDVDQVTAWVRGATDEVPKTVADAEFKESRLITADQDSGVYRGLYALLMARGARDWRTGLPFNSETIAELQPHFAQIFPRPFCAATGVRPELAESVVNRTPMGRRTEIMIDGGAPNRYIRRMQSKSIMEDDEFDAVVATHEVNPDTLFNGDIERFFRERRERFLGMIEYAMNKPVVRDGEDMSQIFVDKPERTGDEEEN
ncbi:DUF262 domain-containing protein [Corynebacterium breve]|uniref:DUF262 domain-containing protein n=1 Tax=Corynebacterium breve TaxID=3049799 RepID=A0ABY8VGQ1_9CORY|nr:DUF262 domain-containing protein [Corynebacterium breve]WIM68683.1 DUF262 domain-containing protein [Corynebacterium breve]